MTGVNHIVSEKGLDLDAVLKRVRAEFGKDATVEIDPEVMEDYLSNAREAYYKAYDDLIMEMKRYLDFPESYYKIIALWVLSTYVHQSFTTFPFLYLNAMRGSAKSRTEEFISSVAYKAIKPQTGITDAVFFRSEPGATLILDEVERISGKDGNTLREYLNAAYKKGGIVQRNKRVKDEKGVDSYKIETFEPFRPIVMANIMGMHDVLGDRCITLILEKSANPYQTKKIQDFDTNPLLKLIKANLLRFSVVMCRSVVEKNMLSGWNRHIDMKYGIPNDTTTLTTTTTLNDITTQQLYVKLDDSGINGRNLELIFPLIITAQLISNSLSDEMLPLLMDIITLKKEDEFAEDKDVSLIEFVSGLERNRYEYISLQELKGQFKQYLGNFDDEEPWLNNKWLGNALKRLNLVGLRRRKVHGREVLLKVDLAKEKIKMFRTKEDTTEVSPNGK